MAKGDWLEPIVLPVFKMLRHMRWREAELLEIVFVLIAFGAVGWVAIVRAQLLKGLQPRHARVVRYSLGGAILLMLVWLALTVFVVFQPHS